MTIAALVRGRAQSYNALFVDTGALGPRDEVAHFDKLHRIFGETYAVSVGDSTVGVLVMAKGRAATKGNRPNLRDVQFIGSIFQEVEGARDSGRLFGVPSNFPERSACTTLVVCNRAEAFYWRIEFDAARGCHVIPQAPTFLDPNSMLVFRGAHVRAINGFFTIEAANAERFIVDQMLNVNARLEGEHAPSLPYPVSRRVSGIVLPHKTTDALTRINPGVGPMPIDGLPAEP